MPTPTLSVDELIETLKRTSLPTVVTEGSDDYRFYRFIEEELSDLQASLFPVGGRTKLLEIFRRRKELGRNNIIFIADQDLWVYKEIPAQYVHRKIIYTDGYSIENDLFRDGEIENFFRPGELVRFIQEVGNLAQWYSFCVDRLLRDEDASISDHCNLVLNRHGQLNPVHMAAVGFAEKNQILFDAIIADYRKLLRGKTLIELTVRHLSASTRSIKFSKQQVMEIGASRRGAHLRNLVSQVSDILPIL